MSTAAGSPTHPVSGPMRRATRRIPFWDNARFACITLVVTGHAIQRLTLDSDVSMALYLLMYAFHMPAFALISGYFSKAGALTKRQMARIITDIILPYVIFEMLWTLTRFLVEGQADPNLTKPSWTLWFLLALGIFRLILPYLALLRWPLLWTVLASVAVGYLTNVDQTFSLARTIGLLPFFTLGWWLREHDIVERLRLMDRRPWWLRGLAVLLFGVTGWAMWFWVETWQDVDLVRWFFYAQSYEAVGAFEWWAGGIRMLQILVALLLSLAFFILIPRRKQWWTALGQYTMYVYLLHSFVLYPLRESGMLRHLDPTWLWLPAMIVVSVLITLALASRPVRTVLRPLIEPRPAWLFADPTLASREGRRSDPTGSRRSG